MTIQIERGTEQNYSLKAWRCFACGKYAVGQPKIATCADDQTVHVGPCCFRKINKPGAVGDRDTRATGTAGA